MTYTVLAGGTGAAKFLRGLCRLVDPAELTIIGNTGDDWSVWGLHVSPDVDTVTYALAGLLDEAKGWGVYGDTFHCLAAMGRFGPETWFRLGDRDLATHVYRTERLRRGWTLSQVTDDIRRRLGVESRLLPMSDQPVMTRIRTPDGWLPFQEFFVREQARVPVLEVVYESAAAARPAPGVVEAILGAAAVLVCPSNPISSIGPILAVSGIREALVATPAPVAAVSPIVAGAPVSGPAGAMLKARGLPVSPLGVAQLYRGWLDLLVFDRADAALAPEIRALGTQVAVADILMRDHDAEVALARAVLGTLA